MTLVEFLLARIAEDEGIATEAAKDGLPVVGRSRWEWRQIGTKPSTALIAVSDSGSGLRDIDIVRDDNVSISTADHIARFDPARVLAECEAKRQIVKHWLDIEGWGNHDPYVLELLALPYVDHPDYREEWRP